MLTVRRALSLLALPLLFASCAPLISTAAQLSEQGPAPDRSGPLTVGQRWTVSGQIDGGPVSTTIPVPALNLTAQYARSTHTDRERVEQQATAGYQEAEYSDQGVPTLIFRWTENADGNGTGRYTCTLTTLTQAPYNGVLTLQRSGNNYTGTCSAQPAS
ncbi:hypothetical protein [Deinococcus sonorensis]|uniref:Ig-like domain-containing protein n=2 Tax=Deinococcus sonorensis TaxID=309891 RepID=A0AAU7UCW6_9DEIO